MEIYRTKTYILEDEVPKEMYPHDFIGMEKNRKLRIQADWYDIERQHENKAVFEGPLLLVARFFFKSEKTMHSKDIDFLARYVLTITHDIIHNNKSSITSIYITKRVSSKNGTKFYFMEDIENKEEL